MQEITVEIYPHNLNNKSVNGYVKLIVFVDSTR